MLKLNKDIQVVFLYTLGRSGSNLLQSLLDENEEILMIPTIIWYYFDWEFKLSKHANNPHKLIYEFIYNSSFSLDWYLDGLGIDKNEIFDLKRDNIYEKLLEVVSDTSTINRKEFLLLFHEVYANVHNINLNTKTVLVLHHHFPINGNAYNFFTNNFTIDFKGKDLFTNALADFPNVKIMQTIRHPYEVFHSRINSIIDNEILDIKAFYNTIYSLNFSSCDALEKKFLLKEKYKFIHYEKMHQNTKATMIELAKFLNITYNDELLISTIGGKLWWGNNPSKPINGTNEKMAILKWQDNLEDDYKKIAQSYFKQYIVKFGYEDVQNFDSRYRNIGFIKDERNAYMKIVFETFKRFIQRKKISKNLLFLRKYPYYRYKLFEYFKDKICLN